MPAAGRTELGVPDDEALVTGLRQGDPPAFGFIVERHYALVLGVCRRLLGNHDDALEASQDVFVKAYRQIGALTQPGRLRSWLTKIARNHALALLRRRRHSLVECHLGQATIAHHRADPPLPSPALSPGDQAQLDDVRQQIRRKVNDLGDAYRAMIRLHYLDGLSLAEIARKLQIPTGTAKWRLSRAKAMLRKEFMMAELSDGLRARATSNPLLNIGTTWGTSGSPREVMKTLLAQQILFCLRKGLKAPEEVAKEVKADVSYVNEHLARMTAAEVLSEEEGRYRANCILFDTEDLKTLKDRLGSRGRQTAEVVARHADELSAAVARLGPASGKFDEGYLRWLILPTMVLNFGLRNALAEAKGVVVNPPPRPDGGNWFYKPSLVEGRMPVELGCNYYAGKDGYAQYWNSDIGVPLTRPTAADLIVARRLSRQPLQKASLVEVFTEEGVAAIIERGLARADGDVIVQTIPLFTPADGDVLDPVISKIIDDVVDQVYAGYPDDVYAVLDSMGLSFVRSDYPAHAQELGQMGAVRGLVDCGLLQQPPSPCPPGWGFFLWEGTFAPMERRRS